MMTLIKISMLIMFFPTIAIAQNMIASPVDEATKDPSFVAYRAALL